MLDLEESGPSGLTFTLLEYAMHALYAHQRNDFPKSIPLWRHIPTIGRTHLSLLVDQCARAMLDWHDTPADTA